MGSGTVVVGGGVGGALITTLTARETTRGLSDEWLLCASSTRIMWAPAARAFVRPLAGLAERVRTEEAVDRTTPAPIVARGRRAAIPLRTMCFDLDSLPPVPPLSGGAPVRSTDVTLEAADGTPFAAFAALPDEPARVGVVVLPDVRGLYRFYEELALRFAERGYPAVAIDYFGRTAGVSKRDDEFPYMEHVAQTTPDGIQQDIGAAVRFLRSPDGGSCEAVFTVGFCFGGRNAWLAAAGGHDLAGAIGFYGSMGERNGNPGPVQRAA